MRGPVLLRKSQRPVEAPTGLARVDRCCGGDLQATQARLFGRAENLPQPPTVGLEGELALVELPAQLLQANPRERGEDVLEANLCGRRQDLDELVLDSSIRYSEFVGVEDSEQLVSAEPREDGTLAGHMTPRFYSVPATDLRCDSIYAE